MPDNNVLNGLQNGTTWQDVMRAVYNDMSGEFQNRIEGLFDTDADLSAFGKALMEYKPGANEFLYSLINHIGLVNVNYRNFESPLKMFKKGWMEFGDTIEDVYIEPIKGMLYEEEVPNDNPGDVWQTFKPDQDVVFYKINRECVYPLTINERVIRRAFMSYRELDKFMSGLMRQLQNGDELDDFSLTMKLLENYSNVNGQNLYYQIPVDEVTDETSAKTLVKAVRSVVKGLRFPTRSYNAKGVLNWARPEDMYLLVTPEINSILDVDVLAKAFNMDKTEFMGNVVEVPGFSGSGMADVQAILIDKEFIQDYDTYRDILSTGVNARHLTTNYYYHHQGIMACSPFYHAIAFVKTEIAEPNSVTISGPEYLYKDGEVHTYTATVAGANDSDVVASQAVVWEIVGALQYASINQNGNLVIGPKFADDELTIKATSVIDGTVYSTLHVVVASDGDPTKVTISGADSVKLNQASAKTSNYTATVTGDSGNSVKWSIPSAVTGASINESTGVLTLQSSVTAESVTIRATSTILESLYAEKTVAIEQYS